MRFTWHAKDLANAEVMAEAVGLPLPVAATSRTAMTVITVPQVAELLTASPDMPVAQITLGYRLVGGLVWGEGQW